MDEKYYAWSNIKTTTKKGEKLIISAGTVVDPSMLNISDEQFEQHIKSTAIRTRPYPPMGETYQGSPKEWMIDQIRNASGDDMAQMQALLEMVEQSKTGPQTPIVAPPPGAETATGPSDDAQPATTAQTLVPPTGL